MHEGFVTPRKVAETIEQNRRVRSSRNLGHVNRENVRSTSRSRHEQSAPLHDSEGSKRDVVTFDILPDIVQQIRPFLSMKPEKLSEFRNTPQVIYKALKNAGFSVTLDKKGTEDDRGDIVNLYGKSPTGEVVDFGHWSLSEIIPLLQKITDYTRVPQSESVAREMPQEVITENPARSEKEQRNAPKIDIDLSQDNDRVQTLDMNLTQEVGEVQKLDIDLTGMEEKKSVSDFETTQPFLDTTSAIDVRHNFNRERKTLTPDEMRALEESALQGIEFASATPFRREQDEDSESDFDEEDSNDAQGIEVADQGVDLEPRQAKETEGQRVSPPSDEKEKEILVRINPEELFEKNFGISSEQLEGIQGYEKLSELQKHVVFRNLQEYADQGKMPYIGAVYESLLTALNAEASNVPLKGSKGMEAYGSVLRQFIKGMATHGPKVFEQEGEILPAFVDLNLQGKREHRGELVAAMKSLNQAAGVLSRTPSLWLEDGIGTQSKDESKVMKFFKDRFSGSRKNYNAYTERQRAYDAAKSDLSMKMREAGFSEAEIIESIITSDKTVFELQFVQTSPDAVEVVKSIEERSVWKDVAKSLIKPSNQAYFGLGFLGRTALTGALGAFAAPTVAATLAGTRSWNRTAADLRERDRAARMSKTDTSAEALNIIPAQQTITIGGVEREIGATHKLKELLHQLKTLPSDTAEAQIFSIINKLKARTEYVEDKLKLNRIQFDSSVDRSVQIADLFEVLAEAKLYQQAYGNMPRSDIENRIGSFLSVRENSMQKKRRTLQIKNTTANAFRAGAFSVAGSYVGSLFSDSLKGTEGVERVSSGTSAAGQEIPTALNSYSVNESFSPHDQVITNEVSPNGMESTPLEPYTIKSGDTLTQIMREQIPGINSLGDVRAQESAIQNILKSLSPEELKIIGIGSGNVDRIASGDTINLELLNQSITSQQSVLDLAKQRFGT